MKNLLLLLAIFIVPYSYGQSKKVLFIGNSYTGSNNLPQLVYDVALSAGDTLIFDKHTPGGARLMHHASNANALSKINSNNWDHVVLQAQSQEPSWPIGQVEIEVFPYAKILCDSIRANDQCTRPVFYMTWGRENGDAFNCPNWPPVCTYEGMDSLLNLRYRIMAETNEAYVSPVGAVWHYLRDNYPNIDLYTGDGSHPSLAGSYAAACTFYSVLFQKDPTLISFNSSLSDSDANMIKNAAKLVAFDSLSVWNVGSFDPIADFSWTQDGAEFDFFNNSQYADSFQWDFGDGGTSSISNPGYEFEQNGTYIIQLIATKCGISDTITTELTVDVFSSVDDLESQIKIFPNPADDVINVYGIPKNSTITIIDKLGKTCKSIVGKKDTSQQINLSDLNAGIYFVKIQIQGRDEIYSEKIVKIKTQ